MRRGGARACGSGGGSHGTRPRRPHRLPLGTRPCPHPPPQPRAGSSPSATGTWAPRCVGGLCRPCPRRPRAHTAWQVVEAPLSNRARKRLVAQQRREARVKVYTDDDDGGGAAPDVAPAAVAAAEDAARANKPKAAKPTKAKAVGVRAAPAQVPRPTCATQRHRPYSCWWAVCATQESPPAPAPTLPTTATAAAHAAHAAKAKGAKLAKAAPAGPRTAARQVAPPPLGVLARVAALCTHTLVDPGCGIHVGACARRGPPSAASWQGAGRRRADQGRALGPPRCQAAPPGAATHTTSLPAPCPSDLL
jgi:hypothetical protein